MAMKTQVLVAEPQTHLEGNPFVVVYETTEAETDLEGCTVHVS